MTVKGNPKRTSANPESARDPERGILRCFADVSNRGQITSATQARILLRCLGFFYTIFYSTFFSTQALDPNMDLRTVRHCIWKGGCDLALQYRIMK